MVTVGRKLRVAVLMGGLSSERNVSLSTGRQILASLDREKYDVVGVDAAMIGGSTRKPSAGADREVTDVAEARDAVLAGSELMSVDDITRIDSSLRPDVAILALHGKYGEDGTIQGYLDLLGLPYTGSGVLASALAMDKAMAKKVLAADGIPVPPSVDFSCVGHEWDIERVSADVAAMGYPVIVKPSRQGSSIGMTEVKSASELNDAIRLAVLRDTRLLVEKFVEGVELTVGVLGNREPSALPVIEIVPNEGVYDYEAKYKSGATQEIVPARISDEETRRAQEIAVSAHRSLGCRGVSRVDMILGSGGLCVLEVNTIPGMTPTSLLPRAAGAAGISFSGLLDLLVDFALEEGADR